uniref:Refilin B n=1 Tax=Loxodonta africana TaxID=9785 RepID=G3TG10_LOXAF
MVGRLSLQDVPELVDTKKKGDGVLDSSDSGLLSSSSHWGPSSFQGGGPWRCTGCGSATFLPSGSLVPLVKNPASLPAPLASGCLPRLCPLSFGEGVEFDPLPPTEVRYTSSVKYDSERHFINDVHMPLGLAVASCSQTVTCVPNCTWRNYRAEVRFEPRHRPARFLSTTIVYPKYPKTVYTTTLGYNCRKTLRRFLSSVELEAPEFVGSECLSDEC